MSFTKLLKNSVGSASRQTTPPQRQTVNVDQGNALVDGIIGSGFSDKFINEELARLIHEGQFPVCSGVAGNHWPRFSVACFSPL